MGALRILMLGIIAAASTAAVSANADDLIIPYACEIDRGVPHLTSSRATVYQIIGPREDLPFSACAPSPSGKCETMMVHKFTIECGGQRVAWARVAASARSLGVEMPAHLPTGFAPVSRLAGRFVLPELVRTKPGVTRVATQDLSPDSVIETGSTNSASRRPRAETAKWVTVVDSEGEVSSSGEAFKVGGVVSGLLLTLMAGCLVVARRRSHLSFELSQLTSAAGPLADRALYLVMEAVARTRAAFRHSYESWRAASDVSGADVNLANVLALVHARLAETELLVSGLPTELLLRDVLQSELDGVRERGADVARRVRRLGADRASAMLRSLMRDLDRITRIVHGAAQRADDEPVAADDNPPASVFEAYRVLGLNPEAPSAAVKKVVDALRMSWHPDHARNDADRRQREERIKQVNAAWDLLKEAQAAA
jgi:hypothetical protein